MSFAGLRRLRFEEIGRMNRSALDPETLARASVIVEDVRTGGEDALRRFIAQYDGVAAGALLVYSRDDLAVAWAAVPIETQALLQRTADRIRLFAETQYDCIRDLNMPVEGGWAGHISMSVDRAGCYIPGGRHPLVSSALMTIIPARAAGVREVWACSPKPCAEILAAAYVAGADAFLAAGGAHAIAALAYGAGPVPACDVIVGPGNRWVTAAKYIVSSVAAIDMLAGPSELVVLADSSADPSIIAADLLAQAEHDPDAMPILVTTDAALASTVDAELARQLTTLPTAPTASAALAGGFCVIAKDMNKALTACDRLAPEHLEVMTENVTEIAKRARCYGALFVGPASAEVFGDYGAGPNHVLPTGGTARFSGGLSVLTFVRLRTWLAMSEEDETQAVAADAARLARIEGLEAHSRSAEKRMIKD